MRAWLQDGFVPTTTGDGRVPNAHVYEPSGGLPLYVEGLQVEQRCEEVAEDHGDHEGDRAKHQRSRGASLPLAHPDRSEDQPPDANELAAEQPYNSQYPSPGGLDAARLLGGIQVGAVIAGVGLRVGL